MQCIHQVLAIYIHYVEPEYMCCMQEMHQSSIHVC